VKKRGIFAAVSLGMVGAFLVIRQAGKIHEPVYQGKTASAWLQQVSSRGSDPAGYKAAVEAIRQIGTNGLPMYLAMIQSEDSRLEAWVREWAAKMRNTVRGLVERSSRGGRPGVPAPREPPGMPASALHRWHAYLALEVLGPAATPAIPKLKQVVRERAGTRHPEVARTAAEALSVIGPEGVNALSEALTNRNPVVQLAAASGLFGLGWDAKPAIPALIFCLKDENDRVRFAALEDLRCIAFHLDRGRTKPTVHQVIIPALVESLTDPKAEIRRQAAYALGDTPTVTALPALEKATNDPDARVRQTSLNSIGLIKDALAAASANTNRSNQK
jgi:hypothetical protein